MFSGRSMLLSSMMSCSFDLSLAVIFSVLEEMKMGAFPPGGDGGNGNDFFSTFSSFSSVPEPSLKFWSLWRCRSFSLAWNGLGRLRLMPEMIDGVLPSESTAVGSMAELLTELATEDAEMTVPEISLLLDPNLLPPLLKNPALLKAELERMSRTGVDGI